MRSADSTARPSQADLDALVASMAAHHAVLAAQFAGLVDVMRDMLALQNELLASFEQLHRDIALHSQSSAPAIEVLAQHDDGLGARNEAEQSRNHSAMLRQRSGVLLEQARVLRANAEDVLDASRRACDSAEQMDAPADHEARVSG